LQAIRCALNRLAQPLGLKISLSIRTSAQIEPLWHRCRIFADAVLTSMANGDAPNFDMPDDRPWRVG
jgi:hypothetical protein